MKKIYAWEPWFFMLFGMFHLHRIWGLIDDLLLFMFDFNSPYWNIVWGFFIALGVFVFSLGIKLLKQRKMNLTKE